MSAISVDWPTRVISIPQSYLTWLEGTSYELDVEAFRLDLKALEGSEEGLPYPDAHQHQVEITLGGITLAGVVQIINGYTVEFEDGVYAVSLVGANNNLLDVAVLNNVSLRSQNSAGLIKVAFDTASLQTALLGALVETGIDVQEALRFLLAVAAGEVSGYPSGPVVFKSAADNTKTRVTGTLDGDGNRSSVTLDGSD